MTLIRIIAAAALAAVTLAAPASAQTRTVKFTLDWALQGNHSIWAMAIEKGHFAREGLNVTMDRGFGSGDAVTKVAGGAYDIGFADVGALIKYNGENPSNPVLGVYQVFDRTLNAIETLKKSGITGPKQLEGKKLGAPETDSSRLTFAAFAKANGIDEKKITWVTMAPNLRETMLAQGQVDAISGFISTSLYNLLNIGIKRDDVVIFAYPDHGVDIYGSAVIVRKDFAEKNPEVVKGFVRATIAGTRDAIADPKAAMAATKKFDPLFKEDLELDRFQLVLDRAMLTENVKKNGFGTIDPGRAKQSVDVTIAAYQLATPPKVEDIFSTTFLPPQTERMPSK